MTACRLQRLRDALREHDCDAIYISRASNIRYLSGYTNTGAALFITAAGDNILITDSRFIEQAERECANFRMLCLSGGMRSLPEGLSLLCHQHQIRCLGFEAKHTSFALHQNIERLIAPTKTRPLIALVEEMRVVKDEREQEALRRAAAATDRVFAALLPHISAGQSERELEWRLLSLIHAEGCRMSFPPIVVSGSSGSIPHGVASDKIIQRGEMLTIDFGCRDNGYCADMTRTVCLGHADETLREIHGIVLEAHLHAARLLRPGADCREIDAAARDYIADMGYGECFAHGLGHGLGLDIHEEPYLNSSSRRRLAAGCAITVEPGIYIRGRGGVRIEDSLLITESGAETLFHADKKLICL